MEWTKEMRHEWLARRCGKLTASRMPDAMAKLKSGQPAKARSDLQRELLAERMTGSSVPHYVNPAMEWGIAMEDEARDAYEAATGIIVGSPWNDAECGVFDHPDIIDFAASPDGMIDRDGLLEIKCPTTTTFIDWLMAGVVPEQHKPQMTAQIACSGRRWCDFAAYDPRIKDPAKRLMVRRFMPTVEEIKAIEDEAVAFLAELERMEEIMRTVAA